MTAALTILSYNDELKARLISLKKISNFAHKSTEYDRLDEETDRNIINIKTKSEKPKGKLAHLLQTSCERARRKAEGDLKKSIELKRERPNRTY